MSEFREQGGINAAHFRVELSSKLGIQIAAAVEKAMTTPQLDQLAKMTWRGVCDGYISFGDAECIQSRIEALRADKKAFVQGTLPLRPKPPLNGSREPARPRSFERSPHPRSPDRAASIRRRREEIASGMLLPHIAAHFTPGEIAALSVIARDVEIRGECSQCVDAIAAVAGVCARVVQKGQRLAQRLGLLTIEERPQPGRKNLSNIVRIVSPEWRAWLNLAGDRVNGNTRPGKKIDISKNMFRRWSPAAWRFSGPGSAISRNMGSPREGMAKVTPVNPGYSAKSIDLGARKRPRSG